MDLSKLKEPFRAGDIEWRLQQSGETNGRIWAKCLAYVTVRAIEARLDEACGSENWKNEFREAPRGGILCGISIKCGNEWVTKWDGADNTQVESVKGGLSDAMKRAGVQWGIGRYLYDLDEGWAVISEKGTYTGKTKEGKWFRWNPPELPAWALPKCESTFQGNGASKNAVPPAPVPETNPPAKGGAGTPPPATESGNQGEGKRRYFPNRRHYEARGERPQVLHRERNQPDSRRGRQHAADRDRNQGTGGA